MSQLGLGQLIQQGMLGGASLYNDAQRLQLAREQQAAYLQDQAMRQQLVQQQIEERRKESERRAQQDAADLDVIRWMRSAWQHPGANAAANYTVNADRSRPGPDSPDAPGPWSPEALAAAGQNGQPPNGTAGVLRTPITSMPDLDPSTILRASPRYQEMYDQIVGDEKGWAREQRRERIKVASVMDAGMGRAYLPKDPANMDAFVDEVARKIDLGVLTDAEVERNLHPEIIEGLQRRRMAKAEQMATFMATRRDESGNATLDPDLLATLTGLPYRTLNKMYENELPKWVGEERARQEAAQQRAAMAEQLGVLQSQDATPEQKRSAEAWFAVNKMEMPLSASGQNREYFKAALRKSFPDADDTVLEGVADLMAAGKSVDRPEVSLTGEDTAARKQQMADLKEQYRVEEDAAKRRLKSAEDEAERATKTYDDAIIAKANAAVESARLHLEKTSEKYLKALRGEVEAGTPPISAPGGMGPQGAAPAPGSDVRAVGAAVFRDFEAKNGRKPSPDEFRVLMGAR